MNGKRCRASRRIGTRWHSAVTAHHGQRWGGAVLSREGMAQLAKTKGGNTPASTLFTFDETDNTSAPNWVATSMLARPFGILDRGFVIPAAAALHFADAWRVELDLGFKLLAPRPDRRASPDRKLVNLCRSVMKA